MSLKIGFVGDLPTAQALTPQRKRATAELLRARERRLGAKPCARERCDKMKKSSKSLFTDHFDGICSSMTSYSITTLLMPSRRAGRKSALMSARRACHHSRPVGAEPPRCPGSDPYRETRVFDSKGSEFWGISAL
jgi:hypothetical protein